MTPTRPIPLAKRLEETTADLIISVTKVAVGALLSGSLVVLQRLVSLAARSGGGPSHLGTLPFYVYVDLFAFGYVMLVAVVAMALAFADTTREALRFILLPVLIAVPLLLCLHLVQMCKGVNAGKYATMALGLGVAIFWVSAYVLARPPVHERLVLEAAAADVGTPPRSVAGVTWWLWTNWQKVTQWIGAEPRNPGAQAQTPHPNIGDPFRHRVHQSALRIVLPLLLSLVQTVLAIGYIVTARGEHHKVFNFSPLPQQRLSQSMHAPRPYGQHDSVQLWDRVRRVQRLDSVLRGNVLQRDHLAQRVEDAAALPADLGRAVRQLLRDVPQGVETTLPHGTASASDARYVRDIANLSREQVQRLVETDRFLLDEAIRTRWANVIDGRHRWLGAMLATLLFVLILTLAFGPSAQTENPYWRFQMSSRLDDTSSENSGVSVLRLTRDERTFASVAVIVISLIPMLRTVDPASLSVERPRSVFDGASWSPVPLTPETAEEGEKKARAQGDSVLAELRRSRDELRSAMASLGTHDTLTTKQLQTLMRNYDSLQQNLNRIQDILP